MIELPEAIVISKQINNTLKGKVVKSAIRGQTPHKFAFPGKYSDEEVSLILKGKTITKSWSNGNIILVQMDPGFLLSLGCGGENIFYHTDATTLPKKHQLLLEFEDQTFLTVTVSGWGEVRLLDLKELDNHPHIGYKKVDPLSDEFTYQAFERLIKELPEKKKYNAKQFFISEPGLRGIGNGVIQDIFFFSNINPKREMRTLTHEEKLYLFSTTIEFLQDMVDRGGRDTEKDLFAQNGQYQTVMNSKSANTPCPACKTPIVKEQYYGGSIYFCPNCQKIEL